LSVIKSAPTVVDLFSGAGLLSLAFRNVGFSIIKAIEKNPIAAKTYTQNLGNHVQIDDVREIEPKGRCDVIIAGPPCQGFSTLGKKDKNDPRNLLSFEVYRWAKKLKPKVVVIENVAAFQKSWEWETLCEYFLREGYMVSAFTMNAHFFGVAQHRIRSFTIIHCPQISIHSPTPPEFSCPLTVRNAWDGLSEKPNEKNLHISPTPSPLAESRMRVIPPGGDKRDVMKNAPHLAPPSWWRIMGQATDVWGRLHWDKPSNTLRTALQNPSKGRYIHPEQNRVISLREAARLQSIPDDWIFCGTPTQIAQQIGNSVPPLLGKAVAQIVLESIT